MRKRALDALGRSPIQRIHPVSIEIINPLGIKGIGEIDVVGTATMNRQRDPSRDWKACARSADYLVKLQQ
jgi:hypothetical protein